MESRYLEYLPRSIARLNKHQKDVDLALEATKYGRAVEHVSHSLGMD
jgi:hypothetical protein